MPHPVRTAMARACSAVLAGGLPLLVAAGAAGEDDGGPWVESYISAAEVAAVYGSPGDAIDLPQAAQLALELINTERRERGLSVLKPDALAQRVAQEHATEMAVRHYVSHYSLAGLKCEARYNALGGVDQISENAAYYEINYAVCLTPQLVRRMHEHWMDSATHRENLLEAAHTHAGCGFSVVQEGDRSFLAGVVEFVNDYGDYARLPSAARLGEQLTLTGALDPRRAELLYVGLGSEDLPFTRSVEYQMSHISGYSPPEAALALLPLALKGGYTPPAPYQRYDVAYDAASGEFSAAIDFAPHWPAAAYYVSVWARPPGWGGDPFCAMTQVVLVTQ